jgi:hypothetical protein
MSDKNEISQCYFSEETNRRDIESKCKTLRKTAKTKGFYVI